jgi:subtilisin family serine protease
LSSIRRSLRVAALAAAALFLVPALATARSVDEVVPGQRLWGELETAEELTVVVRVIDGSQLDVTAKSWKGSSLRPLLTLRDEDGQNVPLLGHLKESKKGNKVSVKKLPLAAGAYRLSVQGEFGSSGGFDLVTKATYPTKLKDTAAVAVAGQPALLQFDAMPGDVVRLKVKADRKSGLSPFITRLVEQDGTETAVDDPKKTPKLTIQSAGKHYFEVEGLEGTTGSFKYLLKIKRGKAPKERRDVRELNARGSISGTIVLEGDVSRESAVGKLATATATAVSDASVRAGEVIVGGLPGVTRDDVVGALEAQVPGIGLRLSGEITPRGPWLVTAPSLTQGTPDRRRRRQTLDLVEAFERAPGFSYVEANRIAKASRIPNDQRWSEQYDLRQMNLPKAWDLETGSASVVIAIVDTGIWGHPDLDSKALPGYDFVRDPQSGQDGNGIDNDPTDTSRDFHGTHVAGTAAAATSNGLGISGVAWGCNFVPVRVLGAGGSGTWFDIASGIRWASGLSVSGAANNPNPARVINLSLGGPGGSAALHDAVRQAKANGSVIVAAAGNSLSSFPEYPAAYPEVISVYALDANYYWASYSNWGSTISLGAPGGDLNAGLPGILSTYVTGSLQPTYTQLQGTSMASPHVAGVAALLVSADPSLTPDEVHQIMIDTAVDLGPPGFDVDYGHGAVDAYAALREVAGPGNAPASLRFWPEVLEFGRLTDTRLVQVRNEGTGNVQITSLRTETTSSGAWLNASNSSGNVPTTITVSVNHDLLHDGTFEGSVIVGTSLGERVIPVRVTRVPPPQLDVVRVKALGPAGQVLAQTTTSEAQGWAYELDDVPLGTYSIVAEADLDADLQLNRVDEFEGRWPIFDRPLALDIATSELDYGSIDVPLLRRDTQFQFHGVGGGLIDGALAVRAFDASTGLPVAGAAVFLGDGQLAVETDVNGRAVLAGQFEEGQTVTVVANGYVTRTRIGANGQYQSFALQPREEPAQVSVDVRVTGLTPSSESIVVHVGDTRVTAPWNGEATQTIEVVTPLRRPAEAVSAVVYDAVDKPVLSALGSLSLTQTQDLEIDLSLAAPGGGARGRVVDASFPQSGFTHAGATLESLITVRLDEDQWVPIGWSPVPPEDPTTVWWASLVDLDPPLRMRFETTAVDVEGRISQRGYVGTTVTVSVERPMALPAPGAPQSPSGGQTVGVAGLSLLFSSAGNENVVEATIVDDGGRPVWSLVAEGPVGSIPLPDVPLGGLEPGRTYTWYVELREVPDLLFGSHRVDDLRGNTVRFTRSADTSFETE